MRSDQDDAATPHAHQMLDQPHMIPLVDGGDDLNNPETHLNQYSNQSPDGLLKKESSCSPRPFMSSRFDD